MMHRPAGLRRRLFGGVLLLLLLAIGGVAMAIRHVAGGGGIHYDLVRDVDEVRLVPARKVEAARRHEAGVVAGGLVGVILAVALAAAAARPISRIVRRPLIELAERVARLDPGQRGERIGDVHANREVARIARGFDCYLERLDAVVAREQAFTGDVSHELRSPLATILSAVQLMLADGAITPESRQRLQRIERAAGHMRELTTALLFLARDPAAAERQPCALGPILQDVVNGYRDSARSRDLRLTIDAPAEVLAPSGMVTSVIGNIVGNAIEHADGGVIDVRLCGRRLSVSDAGPGISCTDVARLFERGYRGTSSHGAGLGLALVARICDHLGWIVEIQSTVGHGTSIHVQF